MPGSPSEVIALSGSEVAALEGSLANGKLLSAAGLSAPSTSPCPAFKQRHCGRTLPATRTSLMRAGTFAGKPVKTIRTKRPWVPGAQELLRV